MHLQASNNGQVGIAQNHCSGNTISGNTLTSNMDEGITADNESNGAQVCVLLLRWYCTKPPSRRLHHMSNTWAWVTHGSHSSPISFQLVGECGVLSASSHPQCCFLAYDVVNCLQITGNTITGNGISGGVGGIGVDHSAGEPPSSDATIACYSGPSNSSCSPNRSSCHVHLNTLDDCAPRVAHLGISTAEDLGCSLIALLQHAVLHLPALTV